MIGGAHLVRLIGRLGELRRCRGRGGTRCSRRPADGLGTGPRTPVRGRGQRLATGERGHGRAGGGGAPRRRLMGAGEHPGAHPERDDSGAEDKEPPPPEGPVLPRVPPFVVRAVVFVAGHLFTTVRIHLHAKSMQLVTLATQSPRRAPLQSVASVVLRLAREDSGSLATLWRGQRSTILGTHCRLPGLPDCSGRPGASVPGRPCGYAGRAKRPSGSGSTRPSATRPSRARARWTWSGQTASRRDWATGSRESLRTARRRPRHCLSVPS